VTLEPNVSPPFPIGLSPMRANLQTLGLLFVFYGYLYGNALLAGNEAKLDNPILSVFTTGGLMLLVVALLISRDRDWRASLGLQPRPLLETLAFGGVGLVMSYAVNIALVLVYTSASKAGLAEQAADKAKWASKLGELPFASILPLALFVGLWEEIVFRGFLLGRLRVAFRGVPGTWDRGTVVAILVVGILFGLGHGYQGLLGLVQTSAVGMALGALTVWRKSLWPAVIAHLTIDTIGLVALKILKPLVDDLAKKGNLLP
jgi:membrane protease YdiL (CAAX protease family)